MMNMQGTKTSKMEPVDSILDDFRYGTNVATAHVDIRMAFLRKVFAIVSIQLLVTTLVAAAFISTESIKTFVQQSPGMLMFSAISSLVLIVALMVKRRDSPANMILLSLFTFVEAYTVGTVVTFYDKVIVLEAFVLTLAVTVSLTMYALQTKRDYSSWGAGLYAALLVLILGGFMQVFFRSDEMEFILSLGGAILFSCFIVYDVNMLMHKLSPEEYILAAINLYLDIINLFLYILRILGESRKN